jgi:hypothetical protein
VGEVSDEISEVLPVVRRKTSRRGERDLDGVLVGVADVDGEGVVVSHQSDEPRDEVVNELERSRLLAVPVDCDVLPLERLSRIRRGGRRGQT